MCLFYSYSSWRNTKVIRPLGNFRAPRIKRKLSSAIPARKTRAGREYKATVVDILILEKIRILFFSSRSLDISISILGRETKRGGRERERFRLNFDSFRTNTRSEMNIPVLLQFHLSFLHGVFPLKNICHTSLPVVRYTSMCCINISERHTERAISLHAGADQFSYVASLYSIRVRAL